MREVAMNWIVQHGYVGLFSLLVLGIVGLPVPDEWLLTFTGYLVFKETFRFTPALIAGFLGSSCGISVSYSLGRLLGMSFLEKYGRRFFIRHEHIERVRRWFDRFGRGTLVVGYFIPGVRHLTGYLAGAIGFSLPSFAGFAYTGAFLWSLTFVCSGYFLGEQWSQFSDGLHEKILWLCGLGLIVLAIYAVARKFRKQRSGSRL